jgi:hypothetical protein
VGTVVDYRIVNSYAVHWVKQRCRALYRQARAAQQKSPLEQSDAHLYLLIATYVQEGNLISDRIPLQELAGVMTCEPATVQRARRRLVRLGELAQVEGGQGLTHVRFQLLKMGGPLLEGIVGEVATPGTRTRRVPLAKRPPPVFIPLHEVPPPTSITEIEVPPPNFDLYDRSGSDSLNLEDRSTSILKIEAGGELRSLRSRLPLDDHVLHIKEEEEEGTSSSPVLERQVERFVHWWPAMVRRHTERAPSRLDLRHRKGADHQTDGDVVRELLEEYPPTGSKR